MAGEHCAICGVACRGDSSVGQTPAHNLCDGCFKEWDSWILRDVSVKTSRPDYYDAWQRSFANFQRARGTGVKR